jgi:hypothetical protein
METVLIILVTRQSLYRSCESVIYVMVMTGQVHEVSLGYTTITVTELTPDTKDLYDSS